MYENKYKVEKDIIYPQEVFELVGFMYDVWNKLGYGHKESFYEKAVAELFRKNGKEFKEQLRCKVKVGEKDLGLYVFDFVYEEKIVVELKQGDIFSKQNINQIYAYLKATGLKLGLLVNFTRKGVKFKRIINIK
ncbi:MAG: GxxExxY protein [Candidatus Moranbacteria bacterium]|nr:GxxExxY protein [Candidatus Moranbacteria bacterium]